jgi:hypothetical protein
MHAILTSILYGAETSDFCSDALAVKVDASLAGTRPAASPSTNSDTPAKPQYESYSSEILRSYLTTHYKNKLHGP